MSEKIRSFVAVDTSEQVKSELARLIAELKVRTQLNVKWVKPEQMHLTLAFLGEVSEQFIEQTKAQLEPVANNIKPFACQIEGLGAFPGASRARVLWAGMRDGEKEIKELQKEVVRALTQIGYVPEKRPFSPHLTLGRLREPADVSFIASIPFQSSLFPVTGVILFRSVLKPEGPEYTVLKEFAFGGG